MLEIIIGILGVLVVILGYTTFNLLRKNEKAEDIILSQNIFINKFSEQIDTSQKRLEEIEEKGSASTPSQGRRDPAELQTNRPSHA